MKVFRQHTCSKTILSLFSYRKQERRQLIVWINRDNPSWNIRCVVRLCTYVRNQLSFFLSYIGFQNSGSSIIYSCSTSNVRERERGREREGRGEGGCVIPQYVYMHSAACMTMLQLISINCWPRMRTHIWCESVNYAMTITIIVIEWRCSYDTL